MSEAIAQPIVNGKFWVIKKDDKKIGSVQKDNRGYFVTTKQGTARYKTIKSLRDVTNIDFLDSKERIKIVSDLGVWAFTIGSAAFEKKFASGSSNIVDQLENILQLNNKHK